MKIEISKLLLWKKDFSPNSGDLACLFQRSWPWTFTIGWRGTGSGISAVRCPIAWTHSSPVTFSFVSTRKATATLTIGSWLAFAMTRPQFATKCSWSVVQFLPYRFLGFFCFYQSVQADWFALRVNDCTVPQPVAEPEGGYPCQNMLCGFVILPLSNWIISQRWHDYFFKEIAPILGCHQGDVEIRIRPTLYKAGVSGDL